MLKLNLILVFLLALVLSHNIVAIADDTLILDSELASPNSMTWPMLPGENLNDIARLFYPKNKAMQQRFIFKTQHLSAEIQPNLKASDRFKTPTLLVIPTLKSLSSSARGISTKQKKSSKQNLQLSLNLEQAIEKIPAKLIQEYEFLVNKNAFLKEQLVQLNEKIVFLQTKLDDLKLILDKTLSLPDNSLSKYSVTTEALPSNSEPTKKVFKNLNSAAINMPQGVEPETQGLSSLMQYVNTDLVKVALLLSLLVLLSAFLLKKYRERMFSKLSFVTTKMQASVQEVSSFIQSRIETKQEAAQATQEAEAAKAVSTRLDATLQEAKMLMTINRATDAIAHLKMTIEAQPKASINHWLYLLEIYRKLNLKEDFEQYATNMHQTFNVMTPVWYETEVAIYVPESLEEFPHIMEKLHSVWPGDLATVYLRNLINDNRGGERAGFGKTVLSEILLLIELLDIRKDLK
jgi:hypothetical protein